MKGRANYLCLHRLDQLSRVARRAPHRLHLDDGRVERTTETGDRAELGDLPEDSSTAGTTSRPRPRPAWATTVRSTSECYVTQMRQRAAESDVVIVNHHLLCADAAVRQSTYGEVIPECHYAVHRRGAPARRRRHAVFRHRRQQLPRRRAGARRRARAQPRGDRGSRLRRCAALVGRVDDHARTFFGALAARRGDRAAAALARSGCASAPTGSATSSTTASG